MKSMPRLSFSAQIFISFLAGILYGLFFGESSSVFEPFASAFVKIMQITVLPFIVVNLIAGIGSLRSSEARNITLKGGMIMLIFWALGATAFFAMQFAFPHLSRASFFSSSIGTKSSDFNLIEIFIPSNPFHSLAEGFLPSIVLFCLLLGFALIGNTKTKSLMDPLNVLSSALARVTHFIMTIIPLGIFVVMANTAGTITLERLLQLQVFLISLIILALLLAFLVLPLLTSCIIPFSYRELLSISSQSVVLGLTTASGFITLPLIVEGVQALFQKQGKDGMTQKVQAYSEVLVPVAYSFPTLGAFVPILFVLFAAWFYMTPLDTRESLMLLLAGVPSLFGSTMVSIQFLLDLMHLPADALILYASSNTIHIHFVTALTCMSLFSFTAICVAFFTDSVRIRWKRLFLSVLLIVFVFTGVILGLRFGFTEMLGGTTQNGQVVMGMDLPWTENDLRGISSPETVVYRNISDVPVSSSKGPEINYGLDRIKGRNALRVGYAPDTLPFAFFNRNGTLVGYDVQMAYDLARFLGVSRIEFVPVKYDSLTESLNRGFCDIVMCAVSVTPERLETMDFTKPYMDLHLAFVVQDWRTNEFKSLENVQQMTGLKIAVRNGTENVRTATMLFPRATLVKLDSYDEFFRGDRADVLFETAEAGSFLALLHPFYAAVQLEPSDNHIDSYAYPIAKSNNLTLLNLLNYWLDLEKEHGELNKKYDYWILGKEAQKKSPRWCVARDVLHWIT